MEELKVPLVFLDVFSFLTHSESTFLLPDKIKRELFYDLKSNAFNRVYSIAISSSLIDILAITKLNRKKII